MVAVVCSIQHFWRILSFIFSTHHYSASEKGGNLFLKRPEKQQPEQLMKEALKALNVHWQCSAAVHWEQVKSEEQSRLQNEQKRNFTLKKVLMDCETSQFWGSTCKGHHLYHRTASVPEHWWHQVHGKEAFRSITTARISQWQPAGKLSGVHEVQLQCVLIHRVNQSGP